jgi:rhamnosyltransferase
MKVSVVVRTYNEEKYLGQLLSAIKNQFTPDIETEVIIVDSGSFDNTLKIAESFECIIVNIFKEDFSFGRSLNLGCNAANGEILLFVSGHCIPVNEFWLINLIQPIINKEVVWCYGRQIGNSGTRYSELQIFEKYFPSNSKIPQVGFYCNNANGAVLKSVWQRFKFDEELTGLEDMNMAQQVVNEGMNLGYVAEANVFHLHDESWSKIKKRFEREAIALQRILPEVHFTFSDFLRYFFSSVMLDYSKAIQEKVFMRKAKEIFLYRLVQYWGSYKGNHSHRTLSRKIKEKYFYPR